MTVEPTPTPPPKPSRKRRTATPRKPRTFDPGIVAIREKMKLEVAALRSGRISARILHKITEKLPMLTPEHRQRLYDALSRTEGDAETGMAG